MLEDVDLGKMQLLRPSTQTWVVIRLLDALAPEIVMNSQLPAVSEHRPAAVKSTRKHSRKLINAPAIRSGADACAPPMLVI